MIIDSDSIRSRGTHMFWGVLIIFGVGVILLTWYLRSVSYDDAFITFRCARNLALGQGLSYNGDGEGSATTTPLWALLLAGLGRLTHPEWIPVWGGILSGVALAVVGFFVWLHARRENQMLWGSVVLVGLLVNPFLPTVWGGEALCCLALSMGAWFFYFERRWVWAGVFCFFAFLARGEGILPLWVMIGHSLYREKRVPWITIVVMGFLLMVWSGVARVVGVGFLPHTLGAKMAQMQSGAWGPFVKTTLDWYLAHMMGSSTFSHITPVPMWGVVPILAVVGGVAILIFPRDRWCCWVIWLGAYMAGYSILAVPFYQWYAFPVFFLGLMLAEWGVEGLHVLLINTIPRRYCIRFILYGIGCGILLWVAILGGLQLSRVVNSPPDPVRRLYTRVGQWLNCETTPLATVGFFEIGYVGYYSERYMVDPVGLVQSDVSEHVARGDFTWAYKTYQPDYIVLTPVRWQSRIGKIREENWFKSKYRMITTFDEPGYFDSPLQVFQKVEGNK